uniref:BTB domain-containing protein n=1 Tax=Lepeophtheirus salmonis TaxID=72036 RepID=A0A0K2T3F0_LEPSM
MTSKGSPSIKHNAIITPRILLDSNLLPSSEHQIVRPTPLRAPFAPNIYDPNGDKQLSGFVKPSPGYVCERTPPERDNSTSKIKDQGFVTNVMIDRSCSIADSGYQILEDDDDEDEELQYSGSIPTHQHPSITQGKSSLMKYKPKRKQSSFDKSHHEEDLSKTLEKANRLLDVKAALEQMTVSNKKKKKSGKGSPPSTSSSSSSSDEDECDEDLDDGSTNVLLVRHSDKTQYSRHIPNSNATSAATASNNSSSSNPSGKKTQRKVLSQETLNTTVTSAGDEFVWIDSHNRLVELQSVPWNNDDIRSALPKRGNGNKDRISLDLLPRLSYYLQRVLVRLSREIQRLSKPIGKCGTAEILSAIKITLSPSSSKSAIKACLRAAAMFAISGDATRQTKSARAGLRLRVGKVHQWMTLVKLGRFVHETAAIYLTAAIESVLEELVLFCYEYHSKNTSRESSPNSSVFNNTNSSNTSQHSSPSLMNKASTPLLSASLLEQAVSVNPDYWGLFQPYAHLGIGRTSSGTLVVPSIFSSDSSLHGLNNHKSKTGKSLDQILLTTCVGSVTELEEMVSLITNLYGNLGAGNTAPNSVRRSGRKTPPLSWSQEALNAFYHFMRCSQLEYVGEEGRAPIQELVYERPYVVLPPLMEWVRVSSVFCEHRGAQLIDKNDVMQAARILLPGMDYPIRLPFASAIHSSPPELLDELQYVNNVKLDTAFKMLLSGRRDLIPHALQMLPGGPGSKLNTPNSEGYTFLQLAAIQGDTDVLKFLVETGAEVDSHTQFRKWSPLCYAALTGNIRLVKYLLEKGASVEGCSNTTTETPLQLVAGNGSCRIAELLLAHGASPFYTADEDSVDNLTLVSQDGCVSAISVAAIHGHRRLLHTLVTHVLTTPPESSLHSGGENQVLSLEEILAEGSTSLEENTKPCDPGSNPANKSFINKLSKQHIKKLQEAMYHASESGNLEITLDLRNMSVPWTLHTWLLSVAGIDSSSNRMSGYLDELLQDFLTEWQQHDEQNSKYFIEEGLSLLFSMFRNCKSEGTLLLLADIFSACYGRSQISPIITRSSNIGGADTPVNMNGKRSSSSLSTHSSSSNPANTPPTPAPRIDPKFVNNPELSDVQFRVDGRIFYAHKLVLVTASSRFQSMINSRYCEGIPPVLQINDIRYDIFHLVMVYLYNGGSESLSVKPSDVLELMAAANFFQLPGLLETCEARCADLIDLDNIVSYYIHAKVYSANSLLEYCEGFLLQNMAALLTYDESVKRLIFGKKLQSHDVLSGLLSTLQKRMTSTRSGGVGK